MTAEPLWGNILIKQIQAKKETKSGIVVPDSAPTGEKTIQGNVIAVGKGSLSLNGTIVPMQIKEGDTVIVKRYEAEMIKLEGGEYYVVDQRQVLLVL